MENVQKRKRSISKDDKRLVKRGVTTKIISFSCPLELADKFNEYYENNAWKRRKNITTPVKKSDMINEALERYLDEDGVTIKHNVYRFPDEK
jgi:hypothetical protein